MEPEEQPDPAPEQPDDQAAEQPDEQAAEQPDEQAAEQPDEQAPVQPDEQPDEPAPVQPDERPDEQRALAWRRWRVPIAAGLAVAVLTLSLLVGAVTWNFSRSHHPHPAQASGSQPAAAHGVPDADGCRWWAAAPSTRQYQHNVGIPPHSRTHRSGTETMAISTNRGPILVRVDAGRTPCTVASFTFLAGRHFFDDTGCHRLVTDQLYLLQCGDPSGTGRGGPGYTFADELDRTRPFPHASDGLVIYPRGTVALANSGRNANGSQFFIVYRDSPIPPAYTPFGTVTAGMGVVDDVAAAGDDGAYAPDPGGGHPKTPVTITTLTVS